MCRQNQKMGDQGLNLLNAVNASGTLGNTSGTADGDATGGRYGPENPARISQLLTPFCAVRSIREFSDNGIADSADHQADLFSLPTASLQKFLVHLFHSIVDAGRGNGNHNVNKNEAGRVDIASAGDGAGKSAGNAVGVAAGKAPGNGGGKAVHILGTPIRMAAWDLDHGHVFANDPKLFGEGDGNKKLSILFHAKEYPREFSGGSMLNLPISGHDDPRVGPIWYDGGHAVNGNMIGTPSGNAVNGNTINGSEQTDLSIADPDFRLRNFLWSEQLDGGRTIYLVDTRKDEGKMAEANSTTSPGETNTATAINTSNEASTTSNSGPNDSSLAIKDILAPGIMGSMFWTVDQNKLGSQQIATVTYRGRKNNVSPNENSSHGDSSKNATSSSNAAWIPEINVELLMEKDSNDSNVPCSRPVLSSVCLDAKDGREIENPNTGSDSFLKGTSGKAAATTAAQSRGTGIGTQIKTKRKPQKRFLNLWSARLKFYLPPPQLSRHELDVTCGRPTEAISNVDNSESASSKSSPFTCRLTLSTMRQSLIDHVNYILSGNAQLLMMNEAASKIRAHVEKILEKMGCGGILSSHSPENFYDANDVLLCVVALLQYFWLKESGGLENALRDLKSARKGGVGGRNLDKGSSLLHRLAHVYEGCWMDVLGLNLSSSPKANLSSSPDQKPKRQYATDLLSTYLPYVTALRIELVLRVAFSKYRHPGDLEQWNSSFRGKDFSLPFAVEALEFSAWASNDVVLAMKICKILEDRFLLQNCCSSSSSSGLGKTVEGNDGRDGDGNVGNSMVEKNGLQEIQKKKPRKKTNHGADLWCCVNSWEDPCARNTGWNNSASPADATTDVTINKTDSSLPATKRLLSVSNHVVVGGDETISMQTQTLQNPMFSDNIFDFHWRAVRLGGNSETLNDNQKRIQSLNVDSFVDILSRHVLTGTAVSGTLDVENALSGSPLSPSPPSPSTVESSNNSTSLPALTTRSRKYLSEFYNTSPTRAIKDYETVLATLITWRQQQFDAGCMLRFRRQLASVRPRCCDAHVRWYERVVLNKSSLSLSSSKESIGLILQGSNDTSRNNSKESAGLGVSTTNGLGVSPTNGLLAESLGSKGERALLKTMSERTDMSAMCSERSIQSENGSGEESDDSYLKQTTEITSGSGSPGSSGSPGNAINANAINTNAMSATAGNVSPQSPVYIEVPTTETVSMDALTMESPASTNDPQSPGTRRISDSWADFTKFLTTEERADAAGEQPLETKNGNVMGKAAGSDTKMHTHMQRISEGNDSNLSGEQPSGEHPSVNDVSVVDPSVDASVDMMLRSFQSFAASPPFTPPGRERNQADRVKDVNTDANTNANELDWVDCRQDDSSKTKEQKFLIGSAATDASANKKESGINKESTGETSPPKSPNTRSSNSRSTNDPKTPTSNRWVVLVAGEYGGTMVQDAKKKREGKYLGSHCSLQSIGKAYNELLPFFGAERIIVIAQVRETLQWLEEANSSLQRLHEMAGLSNPVFAQTINRRLEETKQDCKTLLENGGADYDFSDVNMFTVLRVLKGRKVVASKMGSEMGNVEEMKKNIGNSVTGHNSFFSPRGVRLRPGKVLPQDIDSVLLLLSSHGNVHPADEKSQWDEWYCHFPYPCPAGADGIYDIAAIRGFQPEDDASGEKVGKQAESSEQQKGSGSASSSSSNNGTNSSSNSSNGAVGESGDQSSPSEQSSDHSLSLCWQNHRHRFRLYTQQIFQAFHSVTKRSPKAQVVVLYQFCLSGGFANFLTLESYQKYFGTPSWPIFVMVSSGKYESALGLFANLWVSQFCRHLRFKRLKEEGEIPEKMRNDSGSSSGSGSTSDAASQNNEGIQNDSRKRSHTKSLAPRPLAHPDQLKGKGISHSITLAQLFEEVREIYTSQEIARPAKLRFERIMAESWSKIEAEAEKAEAEKTAAARSCERPGEKSKSKTEEQQKEKAVIAAVGPFLAAVKSVAVVGRSSRLVMSAKLNEQSVESKTDTTKNGANQGDVDGDSGENQATAQDSSSDSDESSSDEDPLPENNSNRVNSIASKNSNSEPKTEDYASSSSHSSENFDALTPSTVGTLACFGGLRKFNQPMDEVLAETLVNYL